MDRLMRCESCTDVYDEKVRIPKTLPCGSILCDRCLSKNSVISCNRCRKRHTFSRDQIKRFPKNFTILQLLENACGVCKQSQHAMKCDICHELLCDDCLDAHSKSEKCRIIAKIAQLQSFMPCIVELSQNDKAVRQIKSQGMTLIKQMTSVHKKRLQQLEEIHRQQTNEVIEQVQQRVNKHNKWQAALNTLGDEADGIIAKYSKRIDPKRMNLMDVEREIQEIICRLKEKEVDQPSFTEIQFHDMKKEFDIFVAELQRKALPKASDCKKPNKSTDSQTYRKKSYKAEETNTGSKQSFKQRTTVTMTTVQKRPTVDYSRAVCTKTIGQWGTGPREFRGIKGLCVSDRSGIIAVVDAANDRLQLLDAEMELLKTVRVRRPFDVCSNGGGLLYVTLDKQIAVITEQGEYVRAIDCTSSKLPREPRGIATDQTGQLYVCDAADNCIKSITQSGMLVKTFGKVPSPSYITVSQKNKVYVSDNTGSLHIFRTDGTFISTLPASKEPNNLRVTGVASDGQSRVLASDSSGRILVLEDSSRVLGTIGGQSEPGGARGGSSRAQGTLSGPQGLAVTNNGDIIVADGKNNEVLKFCVPAMER